MNPRASSSGKLNFCGPVIRRLRVGKNWSQDQLASKCQLGGWDASRDVIARIELQNRLVTDWEIIALAKAFGCEPGELLG
ncbi:helix-turn-helix transcriptional regulator [Luteolibacter marinus]|uniref:helix-turn-helix domain-containing protein n=1 Tax=Luteolibacter marinus TaxID=2776705 RepID=UPI0031BB309A